MHGSPAGPFSAAAFWAASARVVAPDRAAAAAAGALHDRLTKPRGALGRLEALGIQLAAISGSSPLPVPAPATVAVFAGDHGVLAEGVSPWPVEVTAQMAAGVGPVEVLAELGGLEIAALAGFVVGGAAARVPVLVDGVIAVAATLVAEALVPGCVAYCVAGHRSSEPGAAVGLAHLGLVPVLDLDLRLGEGSGACLALPVLQAAAKVLGEMATFDSAGVTDKQG